MDILTIEVGSTITKANAFRLLPEGRFDPFAQGVAATTVEAGDVYIGANAAMADLMASLQAPLDYPEIHLNSSAAGGLRMTVHGLTYNMTARAAREAALGAGAIIKMVTAGLLEDHDLAQIREINPNIILLAGGVDYGEKNIVLRNAEKLASLGLEAPLLYAGNIAIRAQVCQIFNNCGQEVLVTDNVFPDVDVLNVEPVRELIQDVFNRHIIHAPGMQRLRELTDQPILPTPGAVLKGAELFAEEMGDVLVVDVGGATTDVHSVTDGSLEWAARMTEPEPRAKRTVEGDLGVFVNARNVVNLSKEPEWEDRLDDLEAMPTTDRQIELTRWLTKRAVQTAIRRHAGVVSDLYTPTGKKQVVKGKDLTAIRFLVGTGGALTRIPGGKQILEEICTGAGKYLLPTSDAEVLIDREYRFSALGTLAHQYPEEVRATFRHWADRERKKN
ncbi:MAG: glutamate mutase L [Anaerolineaceae bacterium]|nr:glutamate mutase L [Anaerolineaceae bacterium]MDD4043439.1 glutamate mutase L [Anaerolineaceae bacterium]MDD4578191.1 glutamate mutase L [Anaerolineaceae bacterium]